MEEFMRYWEIEFECNDSWSISGIYSFFMRQENKPTLSDINDVIGVRPNDDGLGELVRITDMTYEFECGDRIPEEWFEEWLKVGTHFGRVIINMLEDLVGRRYKNLEELKCNIEALTQRKVKTIIYSESNRLDETDYMIDYEFEGFDDIFTLFYLKDNANNYYITEV
jgi:hypothetical protein